MDRKLSHRHTHQTDRTDLDRRKPQTCDPHTHTLDLHSHQTERTDLDRRPAQTLNSHTHQTDRTDLGDFDRYAQRVEESR